ncbi:hypothetical protein MSG28_006271 [Choristoneura fumiferana]|uniref:Uncharacterized protein n=1 Tax=Choristoneura fumiferana TaxID=7141 RepID=A0ACC0JED1_CHOFU|nr:hypothetical protein MSG28_006271 [Choristoneura fumiferana]
MCNKFTVLSLLYIVIFVAVVQCEEDSSGLNGVLDNDGIPSASNFTGCLTLHAETQQCKHCCFAAGLASKMVVSIRADLAQVTDVAEGRTFGHNALKRLSFIFLPVMFTLGVISTLLMALAVISVKNLAIGVLLLIVSVSQAVSRLFLAAAPSPLVHLHPRAELLPAPVAAPWPAPGPLLSPWARSDNDATISD